MTCANRLKLVVQLRRFVVPEGARRPNLASQCLGLALRQLPDAWHHRHGYQLLLAENFHDPAIHQSALPCNALRSLKDDFNQVADLRNPKNRRRSVSGKFLLPGYDALNDIVNQVDPHSLAWAINQWLAANSDLLPKSLALDGKDLGGKGKLGAVVTLCHHHTGAPLATHTYSGEKNDCELPLSQTLLHQAAPVPSNAVITGDALHAQKNRADHHPSRAGFYLALNDNQPTLYALARKKSDYLPPA